MTEHDLHGNSKEYDFDKKNLLTGFLYKYLQIPEQYFYRFKGDPINVLT